MGGKILRITIILVIIGLIIGKIGNKIENEGLMVLGAFLALGSILLLFGYVIVVTLITIFSPKKLDETLIFDSALPAVQILETMQEIHQELSTIRRLLESRLGTLEKDRIRG